MWEWHDTTWMWITMIVFWSALLAATFFLARGLLDGSAKRDRPATDATAILADRFARGEISEHEYRERRRALEDLER